MEIGRVGHLGSHHYSTYKVLATDSWIKSVWSSLNQFDMTMQVTQASIPLLRQHDVYLMQAFSDHGFQGTHLQRLNLCRMFLYATTLADIATIDGKSITSLAYAGRKSNGLRPHLNWPRQPSRLTQDYWELWQQALRTCFVIPHSPSTSRRLQNPLGGWYPNMLNLPQVWPQWYSPLHNKLYERTGLWWKVADTTGRRQVGRRQRFTFHGALSRELPIHATMMASTYPEGTSIVLEGELVLSTNTERPPLAAYGIQERVPKYLQNLIDDETILIDEMALPLDNGYELANGIREGAARAVSDGSFKDEYGTAAGILAASINDTDTLLFVNSVPGIPSDQSSYRSELAGILGTLYVVEALCQIYSIDEGAITIALDGKEAMTQASTPNSDRPLQ